MGDILNDLSHPPAQPLEPYSIPYFKSPGSYKYYVKGTGETFKSYETDHQKAYREHLENKLRVQFRGGPLDTLGGGVSDPKKNSCKEIELEKIFLHALEERKKNRATL